MILELLASDWSKNIEELYVSEKLFEEIVASSLLVGDQVNCEAREYALGQN